MVLRLHLALFSFLLLSLITKPVVASSKSFSVGDTVFVGIPSTNIRDDAFIIGQVTRVTEEGDYQIKVEDYVEGHDYGAFCTPVAVSTSSEYGDGWEVWKDTRSLRQQNLEYIVSAKHVMAHRSGQYYYIERNNTWVVYGRWLSDAPILAPERIQRAINGLEPIGLSGMKPSLELVIDHRLAFYEQGWGRPYWPYETVEPINNLLDKVLETLKNEPALADLWRAKQRDQAKLLADVRTFFLVSTLDKIVKDSYNQLYENLEKADEKQVAALRAKLKTLGYEKRN
ncbi:hypothetical protein P8S54_09740 [Thiomicrospira sp. R3]|uniref:hypothetical protein n=1 Tax=Thiomicrospira sp. R3 TaxID=3035472 RepID=UPI00259B089F|nr:hypothetical protein [Thiomicrospira sp. R3]WFE68478.1 hypothetical protein P8S54_09740 [Thiomicrospira sp. R3]